MKQLVQVQEIEGEGLLSLLGENVMIWCMNYIYWGKLIGVNDTCVKLGNAHIVYETGSLTGKIKDRQLLPFDHYVQTSSIESFGQHAG